MTLTIFYDSHCPLCLVEMQHLKRFDEHKRIKLVDLHNDKLLESYPHINKQDAMRKLHAQQDNGDMLYGLDVTAIAWNLVGKYRFVKILRWPVIRLFSDLLYKLFAKYRDSISLLLTGKRRCKQCQVHFD